VALDTAGQIADTIMSVWKRQNPEHAAEADPVPGERDMPAYWSYLSLAYAHGDDRTKETFDQIPTKGTQLEGWRMSFLQLLAMAAALEGTEVRDYLAQVPAPRMAALDKTVRLDTTVLQYFDRAQARMASNAARGA
jgi:hypothetical protein